MGGLKDKMRMKTFGRCVNTLEHYRTSGSKMRSLLFSVKESGILTLPIWEVKLLSYKQIHKCFKDCTWKDGKAVGKIQELNDRGMADSTEI